MAGCSDIDIDGETDCDNLPAGGTVPVIYAANYEDIDEIVVDPTTKKITDIIMNAGKRFYEYEAFNNDAKYLLESADPGFGMNQTTHSTGITFFSRTQLQKNNYERFIRGLFVFIIKLKGKDDDSVVVMGVKSGMSMVPGTFIDAHANGGYAVAVFKTPEGDFEPKLPQTLGTDYADALTIIADLLSS